MYAVKLTAKRVVLQLLSAVGERTAPASALVRAGRILGITENSTRVTLARLLAEGTIEATARGEDRLGGGTDALEGGCAQLRDRLHALGLDRRVLVFRVDELDPVLDKRARGLWDGRALERAYARTRERLERWIEHEATLDREVAARESFLLGSEAIRQILFDPRLPEPLVDAAARRALVDAMRRFDGVGRRIWTRLFGAAPDFGEHSAAFH
jgi:DNA-binding transcriptional regulator PaaX